jgi:hypothetical protein
MEVNMSEFTLDDLKERTDAEKDKLANRLKENYQLARKLGFSAVEASILKGKSKEDIERLANERKLQPGV